MKCTDTKGHRLSTLRKLDSRLLGLLTEEAVAAEKKGTFRSEYDYEYENDFWAREVWVLAVVDTVVAVVSSQQKYFSNFCEYEAITFCQSPECLVDKQHKIP